MRRITPTTTRCPFPCVSKAPSGTRLECTRLTWSHLNDQQETPMKSILLWAIGVPIPVILLLWLVF